MAETVDGEILRISDLERVPFGQIDEGYDSLVNPDGSTHEDFVETVILVKTLEEHRAIVQGMINQANSYEVPPGDATSILIQLDYLEEEIPDDERNTIIHFANISYGGDFFREKYKPRVLDLVGKFEGDDGVDMVIGHTIAPNLSDSATIIPDLRELQDATKHLPNLREIFHIGHAGLMGWFIGTAINIRKIMGGQPPEKLELNNHGGKAVLNTIERFHRETFIDSE